MTVYKLTVHLDATLAVQSQNGSFNYFKPSIGAEMIVDETDDLTALNKKFEDLYSEVIGPNFKAVVNEFLINSNDEEKSEEKIEDEKKCNCTDGSCDCVDTCDCLGGCNNCEPLKIGEEPESPTKVSEADLPKEEWE